MLNPYVKKWGINLENLIETRFFLAGELPIIFSVQSHHPLRPKPRLLDRCRTGQWRHSGQLSSGDLAAILPTKIVKGRKMV